MVLPQDCWHNLGKYCQEACGRHQDPLSCCHHSHQHCHHQSSAGLGQGHPECLVVPSQLMSSSPCQTGSIALLSQGHGTALQGPPTFPLSPDTVARVLWTPGACGAGIPGHWGSSVPESLVTLDILDMGVLGNAKDTQTSLCCYQGCQGSHGCWGSEGDTCTRIYPNTCAYTHQGSHGPQPQGC